MPANLTAGAASVDITPQDSQFLFGYPHVQRYSTGVHDALMCSALSLCDGKNEVIFISNDIIFIPKDLADRVREKIQDATAVPADNIMITATHTHSGPITVDYLSNEADPIVPKADEKYLQLLEQGIFNAAIQAHQSHRPARIGLATADATGIGTNRHDPAGPADMEAPVLLAQTRNGEKNIAAMLVCCMHPTVLHEDSTLISGDFPAMTREYLKNVLGENCPLIYHTGPEGNQSPRHVTKANTFEEAARLGGLLGKAVEKSLADMDFVDDINIGVKRDFIELLPREFPGVQQAKEHLDKAVAKLKNLRETNAPRAEIRTAECDWFGAEETLTLSKAAQNGRLDAVRRLVMPAEIQIFSIGGWNFAGWPGEVFVEYDLAVKAQAKDTYVIALANGELQGYIVTPEAEQEGGYEASNAVFAPQSGELLVKRTLELING